jgi:hypothetical protein
VADELTRPVTAVVFVVLTALAIWLASLNAYAAALPAGIAVTVLAYRHRNRPKEKP